MMTRLNRLFSLHKTGSVSESKDVNSNENELDKVEVGGNTMQEKREKNPLKEGSKVPAG